MKLNWLVFLLLGLSPLIACAADLPSGRKPPPIERNPVPLTKPDAPRQYGIQCTPLDLHSESTLQIKLPDAHGGNLAIISPAGVYFFIAFDQPNQSSNLTPSIPAAAFEKMRVLEFGVASAQGIPWSKGSVKAVPIFTVPGTYRLVVSPALETEDPELDGWCDLKFSG
jgi:hypothetical protein